MRISKKKIKKYASGFTFIELVVVAAILSLIFSLGTASLRKYQRRQKIESVVRSFVADLRLAQERALSGAKPTDCFQILQAYAVVVDIANNGYSVGPFCNMTVQCDSFEGTDCDFTKTLPDEFKIETSNTAMHFPVQGRGAWQYEGSGYYQVKLDDITISYIDGSISKKITISSSGSITVN